MDSFGYEIKTGKHIAFRKRDEQKRFTRAMIIGEDYTEDKIKERIEHEVNFKSKRPKTPFKPVKSVIDISSNEKIKNSPVYEFWATKHNLENQIEKKMKLMENRHIVDQYKQIYKYSKEHPEDKAFADEYSPQLTIYKTAVDDIFKSNKVLPGTKNILKDIDDLAAKHEAIQEQLQAARRVKDRLYQYKKNYDNYLGKEVER